MIIDCHTHIFPDQIRSNRSDFITGEPGFQLLYGDEEKSKLVGVDEIIASMDEQGVDRSVVFGFPWQHETTMWLHNDYVIDAVRRYPDRLLGFCCLDPFVKNPVAEVERCIAAGLVGVGELGVYNRGLDEEVLSALDPVMAFCREADLPVMLHTNEPVGHQYPGKAPMTLGQISGFLQRNKGNRIILAHWGGGIFAYHLMKREMKEILENVWFDTAASPYLYDKKIYRFAAELIGVDRILFGSDFPLLKPQRYFKELSISGLTDEQLAAVKGLNAARLFKSGDV